LRQCPNLSAATPRAARANLSHPPRAAWSAEVPAGLSEAIRLKHLAAEHGIELSVFVSKKVSEPGAPILAGTVT